MTRCGPSVSKPTPKQLRWRIFRYPSPAQATSSKIAFCGICHSDLSLINGTFPPQRPVVTQGHEASGTIARLGAGVTGWAEGDRVIVAAGRPCTTCPNCRRGDMTNCLRVQLMAFAYDGAWAEYTVAQAVGLTRVPDNVLLEQAAILADAVSTPFDAVGLKSTFEQGLDCVTVGGRLVSVGMSAESPSVGPTSMFGLAQKYVLGHLGYQNVDIETLEDVSVGIEKLERQEDNPIRILVKP